MPLLVDNIVVDFDNLELIDRLSLTHKELQSVAKFLRIWCDASDVIEVKTSGSTGTPKLISLPKEAMIKSALKTAGYFQYKAGDIVLNSLPLDFIAGKMMVVRAIVSKLTLIVVTPTSLPLEGLGDYNFAFVPMTPYQFHKTLMYDRHQLARVQKILLGGGPVTQTIVDQLSDLTPEVYQGYGMTETITHIAVRNLTAGALSYSVLPGITVTTGSQRELIIEGDHLTERIVTTDIAELQGCREFFWLGRLDNVINTGGIKVLPEVIENKLKPLLPCDCIIIGQEDMELGERVVCILEADSQPPHLLELFETHLDKYQRPKAVFLLPRFLRTETLKIKRKPTLRAALNNY